jgi:hypothetical protein
LLSESVNKVVRLNEERVLRPILCETAEYFNQHPCARGSGL